MALLTLLVIVCVIGLAVLIEETIMWVKAILLTIVELYNGPQNE